jgi:hypothetical protein
MGAVLALCAHATQLVAQEVPSASVIVQAAPAAQELPAPSVIVQAAPAVQGVPAVRGIIVQAAPLQVLETETYAVPAARWGIFRLRLVPRTVYVQRQVLRPARVQGPLYLLR